MNAAAFLRTVLVAFYGRIHAREEDNYDAVRFSADGVDRSRHFDAGAHAAYMQFFVAHHEAFFEAWRALKDAPSQNLFLRVILFRLLGHHHMRVHAEQNGATERDLYARVAPWATGPGHIPAEGLVKPLEHYENIPLDGQLLRLDCWDANVVYTFVKRQYLYEQGDVRIGVQPGDIVLDAGACFGDTAVAFASLAGPDGHVHTFDPLPTHVRVSRHNAQQNGLASRISVFPFAVGRRSANLDRVLETEQGASPGFSIVGKEATLPIISIDDFVKARDVPRVDFIKMDIEGSELAALQGAVETIRRWRPRLAISLYHRPDDFYTIPTFLTSAFADYDLYLGHYTLHHEESVLYGLPRSGPG